MSWPSYRRHTMRSALNWRATSPHRGGLWNLLCLFSGFHFHFHGYGPTIGATLPFGWMCRRALSADSWRVGPMWYFLPELVAERWMEFVYFLQQRGVVEVRWTVNGREIIWWPSCIRSSDDDEHNTLLRMESATRRSAFMALAEAKGQVTDDDWLALIRAVWMNEPVPVRGS